jgi:hypothetical protein
MRLACWITKATDTHSECVILNCFSTTTMVTRTLLNMTLHVHGLCCIVCGMFLSFLAVFWYSKFWHWLITGLCNGHDLCTMWIRNCMFMCNLDERQFFLECIHSIGWRHSQHCHLVSTTWIILNRHLDTFFFCNAVRRRIAKDYFDWLVLVRYLECFFFLKLISV